MVSKEEFNKVFKDTIIREGATYELKELSTYVYEMPKE